MSLKKIDNKLVLYSSSSRQRRNTISPNIEKNKKIGDYLLLSTIGRGTFSKVKLGLHLPTKQKVAIKILDKEKINDEADIERIRREIHILSILRHPNIVQLYETINSDNTIYIIMEYIEGKDLFQYIYSMQHLTEYKSSQLFRQLISCLEYIHKLGIVHRDIKPENILLNKNKKILKLVDFGLGNTYKKDELIKTACGSPCYAAPEMISGKDYEGFYSDLWSCGVVLYCMLVGRLPFDDEDIKKLYHNIKLANYVMPNFLSNYAQDILRRILVTNPKRRIKLDELKRHPFILLSEKTPMYKGIIVDNDEIPVDYDIVQMMKEKYFNSEEDYNINCDIIIGNIKNNLHNKITTIYYLLFKLKYENHLDDANYKNKFIIDNNSINNSNNDKSNSHNKNNSILNDTIKLSTNKKNLEINLISEDEKSPSFVKYINKIDSNKIIDNEREKNSINHSVIKNDNNSKNDSNYSFKKNEKEKKINIHNIKKILFNNTNKKSDENSIIDTNKITPQNTKKEGITINNDNNEKKFNILVINNFMSDKDSSQNEKYQNLSTFNDKINIYDKNIKKKSKNKKENNLVALNIRNKIKEEKNDIVQTRSFITENSNLSKNKEYRDNIINKIIFNTNKNNSRNMKRLHSIKYYQKKRVNSQIGNSIKINNFTMSINQTNNLNKIKQKEINYSNTNDINKINNKISFNTIKKNNFESNNINKIIGINNINLKPFQKCKKINFNSIENNNKLNDNLSNLTNLSSNINAIKNDDVNRHNYVLSKITMNKTKKLNKSTSFAYNQRNGNNKFKRYIKKLFEDSLNNDFSENKSLNITPLYHKNIPKKDKVFKNINININKKNIYYRNYIDNDFPKSNKTNNIIEVFKANEFKNYRKNSNIKNKKINNNANNISIETHPNIAYNIKIEKKGNLIKNKYDFEEKMQKYMKQRFKNCLRKKYSKDKTNNLQIKISNNYDKKSKSNTKSPNSITSKIKSESCSNKNYLKYNNKILINYNNHSVKSKNNSNNNKQNNKNQNNINKINNINTKINNNNFLFAVDFSNVIKKSISRNKKIKNKNPINLNNYNFLIKNDLLNVFKHNFNNSNNSQNKQNTAYNTECKTTYHSRNKSKERYDIIKYSPINNNKKIIKVKAKSMNKKNKPKLNSNLNDINFMHNAKEKKLIINNGKVKKNITPLK